MRSKSNLRLSSLMLLFWQTRISLHCLGHAKSSKTLNMKCEMSPRKYCCLEVNFRLRPVIMKKNINITYQYIKINPTLKVIFTTTVKVFKNQRWVDIKIHVWRKPQFLILNNYKSTSNQRRLRLPKIGPA